VSRLEFAPAVADDLVRFVEYLETHAATDIPARIAELISAMEALKHSPLMGRRADGDKREFVIGKRARGYVALYRYIEVADTVVMLAMRSQLEAGYAHA
jgi:toxin ParE1/3/4